MDTFDIDASGVLEFNEFVGLCCSFNSLCSVEERRRLMKLAHIMQFKMATQSGSPVQRAKTHQFKNDKNAAAVFIQALLRGRMMRLLLETQSVTHRRCFG